MTLNVSLTLPYPPTANNLFQNAKGGGRVKTARYRQWIDEAALTIRQQRPRGILGNYRLLICATPPDGRRRDIDNIIKPISDALTQAGVVADDSNCRRVTAFWSAETIKGGHIEVMLAEAA